MQNPFADGQIVVKTCKTCTKAFNQHKNDLDVSCKNCRYDKNTASPTNYTGDTCE